MATGQRGTIAIPTEGATVEMSLDESTWSELLGASSYTESGGEAPTRESVDFQNVIQIVGKARPATVELNIANFGNFAMKVWRDIRAARDSQSLLNWRVTFPGRILVPQTEASQTVAVTTAGATTFAGTEAQNFTSGDFSEGNVIVVGNNNLVIESISNNGVVTVSPPSSAISATRYSIVEPGMRIQFKAAVQNFGNLTADSEGQVTTTLSLAPRRTLPAPTIVIPTA